MPTRSGRSPPAGRPGIGSPPAFPAGSTCPRTAHSAVYDALVAAADFFALRNRHQQGFDFDSAQAMYQAYETELFRFDQLYRHFCEAADIVEAKNWDLLKKLREQVEACYTNWYVTTLALTWGKFIEPLLPKWRIDKVPNQSDFFARNIGTPPGGGRTAQEFRHHQRCLPVRGGRRTVPGTEWQVSVPGRTLLATRRVALLHRPGHGRPASPQDDQLQAQRRGVGRWEAHVVSGLPGLRSWPPDDGMAVKADDLLAKKKEEGREFISGKRLGLHLPQHD